jgi:hypothetical protein
MYRKHIDVKVMLAEVRMRLEVLPLFEQIQVILTFMFMIAFIVINCMRHKVSPVGRRKKYQEY